MAVSGGQLASVSTKVVKRVEKELQQSKIILRHLPPDFTEEKLTEVISPLPDHSLFYFFPGDTSLGRYGCARAYINFTDTSDILPFRDQYDGTILESEKGVRYRLVIEYAPYQTVPKRKKVDQRAGTLEKDVDYQSFLESYEAEVTPLSSVDVTELMLSLSKPAGVQSTPLVDYLKDRRSSSRYRGSRNKVILFAPNSKKKKGKSDKSKNSKESGDKYEDRKEFSKKKLAKESGDTSGKTVVQVLGREKSKKPAAASSASYNGDSPQPSTRGKGSSRSVPNEGAPPSTDSQSKDSPNSRSRNKDRPDQKFYSRGGRSRGGGSREEGGRVDKRGDVAGKNDGDRKSRPPKGDSDGRTRGRGGRGKSGRYSDYDRGYRDGGYRGDQYRDGGYRGDQYRDGGYRGDQYRGAVDHQYHFQDDGADDTGTGYRSKGGGSRHSSGRGRGSSYRGGQSEYRSSHK